MSGITVDKNSKITIGSALTIVIVCVTGYMSLVRQMDTIEGKLADRYTLTQASENALRMAVENPGMRVPDPRRPGEVIVVRPKEAIVAH